MLSKYTDKLVSIIHKHLPGCKIYLFNLKYNGDENKPIEASIAIDAGIISDPGILGNIYYDIKVEIIPVDFDIVDMANVSQEMKAKILKKGVLLHKKRC